MVQQIKIYALALLVLLGGCSSTTFVYNRLDFLLPWYLGDYVDLDRQQAALLEESMQPVLYWHRMQELPLYVVLLDDMDVLLDSPLDGADIEELSADVEDAFSRLQSKTLEMLLSLGEELSQSQVDDFLEVLEEEQGEYEEKYLTRDDEKYVAEAYENLLDNAQDYLGRLDRAQRAGLEQAAGQLQRSDAAWLNERRKWLEQLREQLRREPGWQQDIRDTVARREESTSAAYRDTYEYNFLIIQEAVVVLLNSRSAKQDKRLRKKLGNLRDDFETLIAQGKARKSDPLVE